MKSPPLVELQRQMAAHILAHARAAAPRDAALESLLRLPAGAAAADRLRVYGDGYPARLLEALQEAFPALRVILGDFEFAQLAQRYLAAADLAAARLDDAGAQLAAHCRGDAIGARLPFAADLAELEWSVRRAFHAFDQAPADPRAFAAWDTADWERAVLRFQPSVAVVSSPWPIRDLWQCRDTPRDQIDVALDDRPQTVLVHRAGLEVHCALIDAVEAAALHSFRAGATLAATVERLAAIGAEPDDVMTRFAAWMQSSLITRIDRSAQR